jgi:hypothetical protein
MIEPPCLFYIRMRSLLAQALNRILGSYKTPAYTTGAQATNSERDVAIILCAPAGLAYSGGYLSLCFNHGEFCDVLETHRKTLRSRSSLAQAVFFMAG